MELAFVQTLSINDHERFRQVVVPSVQGLQLGEL
jgi:hypothetical protein